MHARLHVPGPGGRSIEVCTRGEAGGRERRFRRLGLCAAYAPASPASLDWFNLLYQVLLRQEKGPRFGSFVAVYGLDNTIGMIDGALARSA